MLFLRAAPRRWVVNFSCCLVLGLLPLLYGVAAASAAPKSPVKAPAVEGRANADATANATGNNVQIVAPDGLPVAGAKVELRLAPAGATNLAQLAPPFVSGYSTPEGNLPFRLPRVDRALLWIDASAFAPLPIVVDGHSLTAQPLLIRLRRGRSLSGRVITAGDGTPLAAQLCARWHHQEPGWGLAWPLERCVDADASGAFLLPGLPRSGESTITVEARADGFRPWRDTLRPTYRPQRKLAVELERGVTVTGRIQTLEGSPVPGAQVEADDGTTTASGTDGRFRIALPSLPGRLMVGGPGWGNTVVTIPQPSAPPDIDRPIDAGSIVLTVGQQITGTVLGDAGQPLRQATVVARRDEGSTRYTTYHPLMLDSDGTFRLNLAEAGAYHLEVRAPHYHPARLTDLELTAGDEVDLGVTLLDRGAMVSGRVAHAVTLEPIPGSLVELLPRGTALFNRLPNGTLPRAITDDDGVFLLSGLESGRYELRLHLAGHAVETRDVNLSGGIAVDLGLLTPGPGTPVHGRVTNSVGAPRGGLRVAIYDAGRETLIPLLEAHTDDDGTFGPVALAPDRYRLEVVGQRTLLARDLTVPRDGTLELTLRAPGVRLQGRLLRHGTSVGPGTLTVTSALDPSRRRGRRLYVHELLPGVQAAWGLPESDVATMVREDGTFDLEDAPPGALWLSWQGDDGSAARRLLLPPEARTDGGTAAFANGATLGAPRQVVVDLTGTSVAGVVTDPGGNPLVAKVRAHTTDERLAAEVSTDADGRFALADLPPGTLRLTARADGHQDTSHFLDLDFTAQDAPPAWQEFTLQPRPVQDEGLRVHLQRIDGSPLGHTLVTILDDYGMTLGALPADANGRRRFPSRAASEVFIVWDDPWAGVGIHGPVPLTDASLDTLAAPRSNTPRSNASPHSEPWGPATTTPARRPFLDVPELEHEVELGGTLAVRCAPTRCGRGPLHWLSLESFDGIDLAPYLSGASYALVPDEDGHLTLGRLAPGRYQLELWTDGGRFVRDVRLDPGRDVTVDFP